MRRIEVVRLNIPNFGDIIVPGKTQYQAELYFDKLAHEVGVFKIDEPYICNRPNDEQMEAVDSVVSIGTHNEYVCYAPEDLLNLNKDELAPHANDILKFLNYYEYDFDSILYQFLLNLKREYDYSSEIEKVISKMTPQKLSQVDDTLYDIIMLLNSVTNKDNQTQQEISSIRHPLTASIKKLKLIIPKLPGIKFGSDGEPIVNKSNSMYDYVQAMFNRQISVSYLLMIFDVFASYVTSAVSNFQ